MASDSLALKALVIEGNNKTKTWLIERESGHQAGEKFSAKELTAVVEDIRINLVNLQLFSQVTVTPITLPDDEVMMLITVVERWYLYPVFIIQLAEPNFNTWWRNRSDSRTNYGMKLRQYNFRGRNEKLGATIKFGWTREFALSYTTPYISKNRKWGGRLFASYSENEEVNTGTINNERTFFRGPNRDTRIEQNYSAGVRFRPLINEEHTVDLGFRNVSISDSLRTASADYLMSASTGLEYLSLRYTYTRFKVDRRGYPSEGNTQFLDLGQVGLGIFDRAPSFTELYARHTQYFKLADRWSTHHLIAGKTTLSGTPPYYLQQGLGYRNNSVRSYEFYVVDGQHYGLMRNNLNFKLVKDRPIPMFGMAERMFPSVSFAIHMNLIGDLGYVQDDLYGTENPLSNRLIAGTGLGIDIVTSYDIILRMEYTMNHLGEHGIFFHYRKAI